MSCCLSQGFTAGQVAFYGDTVYYISTGGDHVCLAVCHRASQLVRLPSMVILCIIYPQVVTMCVLLSVTGLHGWSGCFLW